MEQYKHVIKNVKKNSIAAKLHLEPGDCLVAVNGTKIEDVFDYEFLMQDDKVLIEVYKKKGELVQHEVTKEVYEDIGIEFENGLMDEYRSCHNKCIFCFIDQMPKGMRDTLYFKDDDSRLSFLQGNYVTLTNMSEHDIERICQYHLSPINISFQTMNPELRCKMLNNRFAGEALKKVDRLMEAGITMNGQIVLCRGVNDGAELERSIRELTKYLPNLESVSVVPVGLSKYREGLYPLEPFTKEDATEVLEMIHRWQKICMEQHGVHFIHASDEWYILAEQDLPKEECYDGYLQLENGVGMLRLMLDEFEEAYEELCDNAKRIKRFRKGKTPIAMATGKLAYPYIKQMTERIAALAPERDIQVFEIRNDFFGPNITVSGLLTGQDLIAQLNGQLHGGILLLPQNVLRSGEDVFLDDLRVADLENALHVKVDIVKSSGQDFVDALVDR